MIKRKYDDEFKKRLVKLHVEDGRSMESIKKEYNLSHGILNKWVKNYREEGITNQIVKKEIDVYEEVNNQCESLLKIPNAIQNEFIPLHMKENSNINFYNLLIAHYTRNCSIQNFLLMNKGRIKQIDTNFYEAGHFKYRFENDKLIDVFN